MGKFLIMGIIAIILSLALFFYLVGGGSSASAPVAPAPVRSAPAPVRSAPAPVQNEYLFFTHIIVVGDTFSIGGTKYDFLDRRDMKTIFKLLGVKILRTEVTKYVTKYSVTLYKDRLQVLEPDLPKQSNNIDLNAF